MKLAYTHVDAPRVSLLQVFALLTCLGMILSLVAPVDGLCECGYQMVSAFQADALSGPTDLVTPPVAPHDLTHSAARSHVDVVVNSTNDSINSTVAASDTTHGFSKSSLPGSPGFGSAEFFYLFTDVIETDGFHIEDIHKDTDWSIQNYAVSASSARGPYGMNFTGFNVVSNPVVNASNWVGPPTSAGDPGIQLVVNGGIPGNGFVQVAQINSVREDLLYGTYRASIKTTGIPGTCTAFFWYFNDSAEIDFEQLSVQNNPQNNTYPMNLVLQSQQSARQGFSSAASGDWKVADLPFDPTDGFHEYRIDFLPGNVIYYGDGQVLAVINTTAVPSSAGHLILSQWSNGDAGWSAGPPLQPAVSTVGYVKAYFNSSNPIRQSDAAKRCKDPSAPGAVCSISDQLMSPGSLFSEFFSNHENMTNNQTIYDKSDGSPSIPIPFVVDRGWIVFLEVLGFLFAVYVVDTLDDF